MNEYLSAIILAAGESRRMRSCKPLLPLAGIPMLDRCITLFQRCGINNIVVVVRSGDEKTTRMALARNALAVPTTSAGQDMLGSVIAGTSGLIDGTRGFFLLPCDIPLVRPETLKLLVAHWQMAGDRFRGVLRPVHNGRGGHPPLVHIEQISNIQAWNGPGGLGGYFRRLPDDGPFCLKHVEVDDPGILFDIDTPQDLLKAGQLLGTGQAGQEDAFSG
jgi:molybdenum cofactor cytidylyltransferase